MITSAKNYTEEKIYIKQKNPKKQNNGQIEPLDKRQKQSYTAKITQRSIHIHSHKKIKRK